MKKFIIFISILLFLGNWACKKENPTPNNTSNTTFEGEWIWVQSSGGIAGITQTPDDANFSKRLIFNKSTVEFIKDDKSQGKMDFTISNEQSFIFNAKKDFLNFTKSQCTACETMNKVIVEISKTKDTLFLTDDVNDGFEYTYVKKRTDGFLAATYTGIDPKLCPSPCCGGFLLNIEGRNYSTTKFPDGFKFDSNKIPQKILVKIAPTVYSCKPVPIIVTEAK